eukprot:gene46863-57380_t
MMLFTLIIAVVLICGLASAHRDVPEWARGGQYWASKRTKQLTANPSAALTWNAPVDHFSQTNTDTFQQRYYVNDAYWKKGSGPVFFEIGGEGTLNGPPGGFIEQLAANHSALLIALEHRFYGESIPNNN